MNCTFLALGLLILLIIGLILFPKKPTVEHLQTYHFPVSKSELSYLPPTSVLYRPTMTNIHYPAINQSYVDNQSYGKAVDNPIMATNSDWINNQINPLDYTGSNYSSKIYVGNQPSNKAVDNPIMDLSSESIWLNEHNRVRSSVGQNPVLWNNLLADAAAVYASKCKFEHSPTSDRKFNGQILGENLAMGSPFNYFSDQKLFNLWENEKSYYSHPSFPNSQNGHYTQIVNKNVTEIGCGCANCSDSKLCVCRYNPIQLANQYPY